MIKSVQALKAWQGIVSVLVGLVFFHCAVNFSNRFVSSEPGATASIDSRAGFGNPVRAMTRMGESLDRPMEISLHEMSDEEKPTGWTVFRMNVPRLSGGAMGPARGDASTGGETLTPLGSNQPDDPPHLAGFETIASRSIAQPLALSIPVETAQAPIDHLALPPQGIPLVSTVSSPVAMTAAAQDPSPSLPQVSDAGQATNEILTLIGGGMASGGGWVGSGNPVHMFTAIGQSLGGSMANSTVRVIGGLFTLRRSPSHATRLVTVEGTTDEPVTSVIVNGIAATVPGTTFRAEGIILNEGANTITITATDLAGNSTTTTITVSFDAQVPARPTVAATPPVTTATTHTLTGTKIPGTSIWVNGVEVVPLGDATVWTATVSLVEGDNALVIVSKGTAGNPSTTVTVTITVDNLPPVVTFQPPAKTNLTPIILSGTVDDSLTTVTINGTNAVRAGRTFEMSLPLTLGPNSLRLVATSPNGYVTAQDVTITLGTIPTIQTTQPPDAAKVYAGATATIQVSATDQEGDPIEYQLVVDGIPLSAWGDAPTASWSPGLSELGLHTVRASARDGYGGSSARDVEVLVVRQPVQHP